MQIVVIGGAGVLGQALMRAIVARGTLTRSDGTASPVQRLISVDRHQPPRLFVEPRIEYVRADLGNPRLMAAVMGTVTDSVLHAWDAADGCDGDADAMAPTFALADSLRDLLRNCAAQLSRPKIVLASTYAALGRETADRIGRPRPPHGEGLRLRIAELLLAEAARLGRIDARALRLPAIAAAPGPGSFVGPLLAALREGGEAQCPVPADTVLWLTTASAAAQALVHAHELPPMAWNDVEALNVPARLLSVASLIAAAGRPLSAVDFRVDAELTETLARQPCEAQVEPALDLGFAPGLDAEALVRQLA
jgi:D-erythronate 2-dehydrogenase